MINDGMLMFGLKSLILVYKIQLKLVITCFRLNTEGQLDS